MIYERIDAFDMNFEECAASKKYKLAETRGMGERRLYVGHDEKLLDEFFDTKNIEYFFMLKNDLIKYLVDAEDEFKNPTQEYKEDISRYFDENVHSINLIERDRLIFHFTKKYDSQNRYYLNLADGESGKQYNVFRNIALPRVTRLSWVKIQDKLTRKIYIYIKPSFFIEEKIRIQEFEEIILEKRNEDSKKDYRKKQIQYRRNLLDLMPACVITKVTEDRILEACHIKPFNKCVSDEEKYDINNGLILTPTYHLLFDLGFISFKDNGELLISPFLSNLNKTRLKLKDNTQYRIPLGCKSYLDYHRKNVFSQIPAIKFD